MKLEIVDINNGFLVIEADSGVRYCKDVSAVHSFIEFLLNVPPPPSNDKEIVIDEAKEFVEDTGKSADSFSSSAPVDDGEDL